MYRFEKVDTSLQATDQLPDARSGHRLTEINNYIFSVGGFNIDGGDPLQFVKEEVFALNTVTGVWSRVHTCTYDESPKNLTSPCVFAIGNNIFVFGGSAYPFGTLLSNKVYRLPFSSLSWTVVNCDGELPSSSYGQGFVYANGFLYIVGGTRGYDYSMDVHQIRLADVNRTWKKLDNSLHFSVPPPSRYRHEIVYHEDCLYVFGGGTPFTVHRINPIPVFDLKSCTWKEVTTKADQKYGYPAGRLAFGFGRFKDRVFICGGMDGNGYLLGDVWSFDLVAKAWTRFGDQLPSPCAYHGCTVTSEGLLVVFGGITNSIGSVRTANAYCRWIAVPRLRMLCLRCVGNNWTKISSSLNANALSDFQKLFPFFSDAFEGRKPG